MHCLYTVTEDIYWIGGNDRKISKFEGAIPIADGMAYNAYYVEDEQTVVLDTVDSAVSKVFFENIAALLGGRELNYLIVHHVEPDHSASLEELLLRHPETRIVGTAKIRQMLQLYVGEDISGRFHEVKEGEELVTGKHRFTFMNAPMVHWPEVMVSYEASSGTLFSADAFGLFGAHDGNLFADAYDFDTEWLPAARSYYTTIVGKYGSFTSKLLDKVGALDIRRICPLHGYVIRQDFEPYLSAYRTWASYRAEERGVLILYASPYGHTQNAAEILARDLAEQGVARMKLMDVSQHDPMDILPQVFRFSHIVTAATTYNGDVFIKMEETLLEMKSMGVSDKRFSIIQSGSWNPASGKQIQAYVESLKACELLGEIVTLRGAVREETAEALAALAESIAHSVREEG